jgi:chromosomal replication initiation ATPase DnaA
MVINSYTVIKALQKLPNEFSLNMLSNMIKEEMPVNDSCDSKLVRLKDVCEQVVKGRIFTQKRNRYLSYGRMVFTYIAREYIGHKPTKLSEYIDRDHSTVIYYVKQINQALEGYNPELLEIYNEVKKILNEMT